MPPYQFRLRQDMPQGFRKNDRYPELPAAVEFLSQSVGDGKIYSSPDSFQVDLDEFPEYLRDFLSKRGLQLSSDRALSAGLLLEYSEEDVVHHVVTISDDNQAGRCTFGFFGDEEAIAAYQEALEKAGEAAIAENDDNLF